MKLFAESPEGRVILDRGSDFGWADILMDYGISYEGVTPATMTAPDLETVLFSTFPHKVSAPPETAPDAIREIRAFWQFLSREFELKNARSCLKVLDDRGEQRLAKEMGNPANFGEMARASVVFPTCRGPRSVTAG